MSIEILSSEVVDQIAAGEVVERPAHLLKELLENSLDAGATEIEVSVSDGGRHLIVTDNGKGMDARDLKLCTDRHATSKISKSSDIFQLSTYGFRGEALASAAAISHLVIDSKPPKEPLANRLSVEFGVKDDVCEVGGVDGTRVSVSHLFDNVPARKKFLKSDTAEVSQIKLAVKAMALAYPAVQFKLLIGSKLEFLFHSADEKERCEQVLGQKLYHAHGEDNDIQVECYFTAPNDVMRSSKQIWLFAQDRWINDRSLQTAVTEAYRSYLMHGEYPYAVIKVRMNPEDIDVNIHPTKSQVKFHDARRVFRVIHYAIRGELEKAPWLEGKPAPQVNFEPQPVMESLSFDSKEAHRTQYAQKNIPTSTDIPTFEESKAVETSVLDQLKNYAAPKAIPAAPKTQWVQGRHSENTDNVYWSQLQVLGQANLTYIITQSDDEMILIDQHAAHERVLYEQVKSGFDEGKFDVQNLLIPLTLDLPAEQCEALNAEKDQLKRFGIEIELNGPESIAISQIPSFLKESAALEAIGLLAEECAQHSGSFAIDKKVGDICATMACHSAIRAGQALSMEQMRELLVQMDQRKSSFCPHGRPVFVRYPFAKLESDFGRRV